MSQQERSVLRADEKRELLKRLLREKLAAEKCFPMSAQQAGLWHAFRRDAKSTAYNVFLPTRIRSPLQHEVLVASIHRLAARHHSLRTTFSDHGGRLNQTVQDSLDPEVTFHHAHSWSEDQIREAVLTETQRPFDLTTGPLLRLAVFEAAASDHIVVATTHHIITDFWSLVVVMDELGAIYPAVQRGEVPTLEPPNNNYHIHVQQQAALLAGDSGKALRDYWKAQVVDIDPILSLTTDLHRPEKFTHRGSTVPLGIDAETSQRLREFAASQRVTVNAVLLAGIQVLLHRHTNQTQFLIGSPFSGRLSRDFEKTIGLFSNVLPLRCEVKSESSFVELIRRTSETLVSAIDHEGYPFANIVQDVNPVRDISRSPLIQTLCTFENSQSRSDSNHASLLMPGTSRVPVTEVGGLRQEAFHLEHPTCHYDLEFAFDSSANEISGQICYCIDLFDRTTIERMTGLFIDQLAQLIRQPNHPLRQVRTEQSSIACGQPTTVPRRLNEMLDVSLIRSADQAAIRRGDHQLSFAQLSQLATTVECLLNDAGVGQGDLLPVIAPSGPEILPAILAVSRIGGVIVPIDQTQPSIDIDELLKQTQAQTWLSVVDGQICINRVSDAKHQSRGIDAAYVIYTSGSTGPPKGVLVGHEAIANTLQWRHQVAGLRTDDRVLMLLSHQFDAGFGVILQTLTQGACLIWPRTETTSFDLDAVIGELIDQKITVVIGGPSVLRAMADHPRFNQCTSVRQIWTGGEILPSDLPEQISRCVDNRSCQFWNFYGPTETAIEATAYRVPWNHDPLRPVSIGSPIHNMQISVIGPDMRPVPSGVPGQLAISGPGLADGYLNEPELTQSKFVTLPTEPPRRAYLTGDLGRLGDDGMIDFLGRMDQQVKLRGYRIELEEIDRHLAQQQGITDAATCVIGHGNAARLVAGVIGDATQLDLRLPKFKRPDRVLVFNKIPRNASGKVDRRSLAALAEQELRSAPTTMPMVLPSNSLEQFLAQQWCEILDVDSISINESFFDLGGSSLQAAMLTSRLSQELAVTVPTALLFDLADVRSMSEKLLQLYPDQLAARFDVQVGETASSDRLSNDVITADPLIHAWQCEGNRPPLVMIHPPGGIVICYRDLAQHMAPHQSLYAVRSRGLHGDEPLPETMNDMAADYVRAIETTLCNNKHEAPLQVGGWSLGGLIAVEVARQLKQNGHDVQRLLLLDTTIPDGATPLVSSSESSQVGLEYGIELSLDQLSELEPENQLPFLYEHAQNLGVLDDKTPIELVQQTLQELQRLFHHHVSLANAYKIERINTPITLFRPIDIPVQAIGSDDRGWSMLCANVQVIRVPGQHHSMLSPPHVGDLASQILAAK